MTKLNVALIFGGKSGEHEVSLSSAASIYENINKDKYRIKATNFSLFIKGTPPKK